METQSLEASCPSLCELTADPVGVIVRSAQEVWQRHQQRGQRGQQSSAPDEPRPVDSTPEETHKHDEDGVSHLDTDGTKRRRVRAAAIGENVRREKAADEAPRSV